MPDIVERLRTAQTEAWFEAEDLLIDAIHELERLRETEEAYRELFKRSCEKTVYIAECEAEIERLRAQHDLALMVHNKLADEITRLRSIPDWKIGEGKPS